MCTCAPLIEWLSKDLQVNSADTEIKWNQVFDTNGLQAGVHSELNVDNMGRFIILQDKIFTVDADTPQKTCPYTISGSRVGSVRYNGASGDALTDKGVYVIWAAFVMGYQTAANGNVKLPPSRPFSFLFFRRISRIVYP